MWVIIIVLAVAIILWLILTNQSSHKEGDKIILDDDELDDEEKSGLFDQCPCATGLVCDNGICKLPSYNSCIMSSQCPEDNICFNGTCVPRPSGWEESISTTCTDSMVCVSGHIMKLQGEKFIIMPNWWILDNIYDIVSSPRPGYIIVANKQGIWHIPSDDSSEFSKSKNHRLCDAYIYHPIKKLFYYKNYLHCLSGGKIYKGPSSQDLIRYNMTEWGWEPIIYLHGRDMSHEVIDHVYESVDGTITLVHKNTYLTYSPLISKWRKDKYPKGTEIIYSPLSSNYVEKKRGTVVYHLNGHKVLKLTDVISVTFDPTMVDGSRLIVIFRNGWIKAYTLLDYKRRQWHETFLHGSGREAKCTDKDIWIISNQYCQRI
jgi:hypothetical protein